MSPRSVRLVVRSRKLSNVGRSLDGRPFYYLELLRAFAVVSTHQFALSLRGGLWPVLLISKRKACAPGVGT
jgi:hypothetical protein